MGQIDPSLQKTIADTQKRIKKLAPALAAATAGSLAMKGAFSLTKNVIALTGTAAIEAGKYLKDLGSQFDEAADAIRIGTGATGDALDGLLDDFDEVYKSVPTTMEDASKAIADYNTRLGLTGPQLQEISKQALQVSDNHSAEILKGTGKPGRVHRTQRAPPLKLRGGALYSDAAQLFRGRAL